MKTVSIERLKTGQLVVASYTQSPPGFWEMNGFFQCLPETSSAEVVGVAVADALNESNTRPIPARGPGSSAFSPVLKELGFSSYTAYMKGARSVSVDGDRDSSIVVSPTRNGGAREGFVELPELARTIVRPSAIETGRAVLDSLEDSL